MNIQSRLAVVYSASGVFSTFMLYISYEKNQFSIYYWVSNLFFCSRGVRSRALHSIAQNGWRAAYDHH